MLEKRNNFLFCSFTQIFRIFANESTLNHIKVMSHDQENRIHRTAHGGSNGSNSR